MYIPIDISIKKIQCKDEWNKYYDVGMEIDDPK